jgi:hypothetical protein
MCLRVNVKQWDENLTYFHEYETRIFPNGRLKKEEGRLM